MIDKTTILNLADYVLINAYSVNATGLFNGKAGLSVCLFEIARLYRNEVLEEHAFELLQEALLSVSKDVDFKSGLPGIGHALHYLIRNDFLEGDVDELFGNNRQFIYETLYGLLSDKNISQWIHVLYYLIWLRNESKEKVLLVLYVNHIIDSFTLLFSSFLKRENEEMKMNICTRFADFLQFVHCLDSETDNVVYDKNKLSLLCRQYHSLRKSGRIAGNNKTNYFLLKWMEKEKQELICVELRSELQRARSRIYTSALSLKEKLDWLFLLNISDQSDNENIRLIEDSIFHQEGMNVEQSIVANLDKNDLYFSYNNGIARLLLYFVFKQGLSGGDNVTRFNYIFI